MRRFLIQCIFVLVFSSFALAQDVSVRNHSNFSGITETLKELIKRNGKAPRNTFYISSVRKDGYREFAYAYWKQDNSIIILRLPLYKSTANYEWLYSKARINLLTDVVPTKDDIGGSSFLVDKKWLKDTVKRCLSGYKLTILNKINQNGISRTANKIRRNKSQS